MADYRAITIEKGSGGFGGPLTVKPEEGKDVLLFITGGGAEPEIVEKIVSLTGCRAVNGFKTTVPEKEIFLVILTAAEHFAAESTHRKEFRLSTSIRLENQDRWQNISQKTSTFQESA